MSKGTDNYRELAMAAGLQYDAVQNVIYGQKDGFEFLVYATDARYPYMLTIQTSAKNAIGTELTKDEKKEFVKSIDKISAMDQKSNTVIFRQNNVIKLEQLKMVLANSINGIVYGLRARGYCPCCGSCGQSVGVVPCEMGSGNYVHLCPDCEVRLRDQMQLASQQNAQKKENVIGGIVGALLGSLIGVLCIVIVSRLGYVSAWSGIVMAICVMKGYEILGKKISKKGIVISIIIMLFMTYVGDRIDWAIVVATEWDVNIFDSYRAIPGLLSEGYIEMGSYVGSLILLYVFLLLGAVPTTIVAVKDQKTKNDIVRIGNNTADYYN